MPLGIMGYARLARLLRCLYIYCCFDFWHAAGKSVSFAVCYTLAISSKFHGFILFFSLQSFENAGSFFFQLEMSDVEI